MQITSLSQLDLNGTYSYADYATWKFDQMVELIRGKIVLMSPAPLRKHQRMLSSLGAQILPFFQKVKCEVYTAPFDVRLVKGRKGDAEISTVVQPDICVVCDENKLDEKGCIGSPDWIIEILSPSTAKKDYNEKFNLYQENEVREYWIVNPDANVIDHFILDEQGVYQQQELYTETQTVFPHIFPELAIDLKWVFKP